MLARRGSLRLPNGSVVDLPRLVPSFSSKGFKFRDENGKGKISESSDALEMMGPSINDSILVSAFDISNRYLYKPERFFKGKELVFIDSGGYELSEEYDSSEPDKGSHKPFDPKVKQYDSIAYLKVLNKLPKRVPIAISNFDHDSREKDMPEQIEKAQILFNKFPNFLHDFIIKPTGTKKYIDTDDIIHRLNDMRKFHIIGVTEKELGSSILDRLISIATIRNAMDGKNINSPLHIFGGLDPVITPLYFCAGAEIFDGVSWMRYGFYDGYSVPTDAYTVVDQKIGIQAPIGRAVMQRFGRNISYLEHLTMNMKQFVDDDKIDFEVFGNNSQAIKNAYNMLTTKIPALKGGL